MPDILAQVPKTYHENLQYRLRVGRRAEKDAGLRRAIMAGCKHDILYFFNAWCWLYEPRPEIVNGKKKSHVIPFITWPHQDPAILEAEKYLGFEDIGAEKSRGEGASWIALYKALKDWNFERMVAIGLVSRNEEAVDDPNDPDSLMWKLDWAISRLPVWMVGVKDVDWKRSLSDHTLNNRRTGSSIAGYAATGDVASGGRKTWFLMDELAKFPKGQDYDALTSTQHVTNSRFVVSTPKGRTGAYAELMHAESSMRKIVLDWKDNPTRNRGLYRFEKGLPVAIEPARNPLPKSYTEMELSVRDRFQRLQRNGFELEQGLRSPWFDEQCDRMGATPQRIAQELNRDYGGSKHNVFKPEFFKAAEADLRPPMHKGTIEYSVEDLDAEFQAEANGLLHLWTPLDVKNRPPKSSYIIGGDPSYGMGGIYTNNSALVVVDQSKMEQVAEFAVHTMQPEDFAEFTVALAKWFWKAWIMFEANGPGMMFAKKLIRLGYPHVFERTDEIKNSAKTKNKIGWWSSPDNKRIVIGAFNQGVRRSEIRLRSKYLVEECHQYEVIDGEICNASAAGTSDDLSKKHSHADRVIAACLAYHGCKRRPVTAAQVEHHAIDNPPYGTLAWREKMFRDEEEKQKDDWDSRTCDDLASGDTLWKAGV
jgi:hypothetical protein